MGKDPRKSNGRVGTLSPERGVENFNVFGGYNLVVLCGTFSFKFLSVSSAHVSCFFSRSVNSPLAELT